VPEINNKTLVVAIQAVASQVKALRWAAAADGAKPEELVLLEAWLAAADDLERAYDVAARTVINLPPYDELSGG